MKLSSPSQSVVFRLLFLVYAMGVSAMTWTAVLRDYVTFCLFGFVLWFLFMVQLLTIGFRSR